MSNGVGDELNEMLMEDFLIDLRKVLRKHGATIEVELDGEEPSLFVTRRGYVKEIPLGILHCKENRRVT